MAKASTSKAPSQSAKSSSPPAKKARRVASSSSDGEASAYENQDDAPESNSDEEDEAADVDSDRIDESDDEPAAPPPKKRKAPSSATPVKASTAKKDSPDKSSATKKKVASTKVADLVPAPKSRAPDGQISKTTLTFLRDLAKNNEREWLQRHDAPYRHALDEWKRFVDVLSEEMSKADWTMPILPAKDLVHRLARDIRFSNDKTPFKLGFQASFSRTGRKGPYAGYFAQLQPGGKSFIAGGRWGCEKNDLATIRTMILRDPSGLRDVLAEPEFVKLFGEPKAEKGKRSNIFGRDDELKNAPKLEGVDKKHKDIDLLKCKSFVVSKRFEDDEVLKPDFVKELGKVVAVMTPLVQLLNELTTPTSLPNSDAEDDNE